VGWIKHFELKVPILIEFKDGHKYNAIYIYKLFPCVYKQMLRWFPKFQVALHASHVGLQT